MGQSAVPGADIENVEVLSSSNSQVSLEKVDLEYRVQEVTRDYFAVQHECQRTEQLVFGEFAEQTQCVDRPDVILGQGVSSFMHVRSAALPNVCVVCPEGHD